jgi:hypothetical protein
VKTVLKSSKGYKVTPVVKYHVTYEEQTIIALRIINLMR